MRHACGGNSIRQCRLPLRELTYGKRDCKARIIPKVESIPFAIHNGGVIGLKIKITSKIDNKTSSGFLDINFDHFIYMNQIK